MKKDEKGRHPEAGTNTRKKPSLHKRVLNRSIPKCSGLCRDVHWVQHSWAAIFSHIFPLTWCQFVIKSLPTRLPANLCRWHQLDKRKLHHLDLQELHHSRLFKVSLWMKNVMAYYQMDQRQGGVAVHRDFHENLVPSLKLTQPLKMDGWNTTFLLGRPIFRGYDSFREGKTLYNHLESRIPFSKGHFSDGN